jgi:hypothetical protein
LNQLLDSGSISDDASDIAPDRALVFELRSPLGDFEKEANRVGLTWLIEGIGEEPDELEAEQEAGDDEEPEARPVEAHRLYVSMPTRESLTQLLTLWDLYRDSQRFPPGYSAWWGIFAQLEDLRPWGPKDRLDAFSAGLLGRALADKPDANVLVEVTLWFATDPLLRTQRRAALAVIVDRAGGTVHDVEAVPEIGYHGMLIGLPAGAVSQLLENSGELIEAHQVMSIQPQSMGRLPIEMAQNPIPTGGEPNLADLGEPVAALLDGYPIENHVLLRERIDVFPLEVDESMAEVRLRRHGTQMASLIVHGDRGAPGEPIGSRLLVLPVLATNADEGCERTPPFKLAIGLIRRAIEAIVAGTPDTGALGAGVVVINHSLGNVHQPFFGQPSYWAKLLDHLAFKHSLLFVVSAGNVDSGFEVEHFASIAEFQRAGEVRRLQHVLMALERGKHLRSMLSPAEAMNVLTVGAAHHDHSDEAPPPASIDALGTFRMSNLGSGVGLGMGDAVKPDMILPGGRQIAQPFMGATLQVHPLPVEQLGQLAAAPDAFGRRNNLTQRSTGTSNAAALATRATIRAHEAVREVVTDTRPIFRRALPAILKCLVAHGCDWGAVGAALDGMYPPNGNWYRRRRTISAFLGFGEADTERVLDGTTSRVTMFGYGEILNNKRDVFEFPLPNALASRTDLRRITATLAWLSPLRVKARNYRAIGLELTGPDGRTDIWDGVTRQPLQPPHGLSVKGTLMHRVFEGHRAIPFATGSNIEIGVQSRSIVTAFNRTPVPYALALTIQVANTIGADIYVQVRDEIRNRAGAARVRAR